MSRDLEDGQGAVDITAALEGAERSGGDAVAAVGGGGEAGDEHDNDVVMPGFRFHPTEEELIEFYLRRKVEGKCFNVDLIAFLDLYRYDPWELPGNNNQFACKLLCFVISSPPIYPGLDLLGSNLDLD
ncbi:hypothetical protein HU200_008096 [Digitaria exilis]|uniref:NAC domain-containing protein n=1 Tax=Digitaria exilis TaxID=1010633 RepID=A0A835FMN5_9POAL|nr:hypothetical protein HU200_008096 [Digitaria exilis]